MKQLIATIILVFVGLSATAAEQSVIDKYNRSCIACHAAGAAGAPRSFQVNAWAPRLEKGMPALLQSVEKGLNAMPPKGLCMDCSVDEVQALITYMSTPKN